MVYLFVLFKPRRLHSSTVETKDTTGKSRTKSETSMYRVKQIDTRARNLIEAASVLERLAARVLLVLYYVTLLS